MVLNDGTLPSRTITDTFHERVRRSTQKLACYIVLKLIKNEQAFDESFSKAHPLFHWLYRTSRNWKSVVELLPNMRSQIKQCTASPDPIFDENFVLFREQFCVAAAELADALNQPLERLGVLFDEVVLSGTSAVVGRHFSWKPACSETGGSHSGNGKVLFGVRRVDPKEVARLCGQGFRFTDPTNVVNALAKALQVPKDTISKQLASMSEYSANAECLLSAGVHVGCFALRATVRDNFEVLVRQGKISLLPTAPLLLSTISMLHTRFLRQYDGKSVDYILQSLGAHIEALSSSDVPTLTEFISRFHSALTLLKDEIADPFFGEALLVPGLHNLPSSSSDTRSQDSIVNTPTAALIAFKYMIPIHTRQISTDNFMFSSIAFFAVQQRCYPGCSDHAIHARMVYGEFCARGAEPVPQSSSCRQGNRTVTRWNPWMLWGRGGERGSSRGSISSEKNLVATDRDGKSFGPTGIMVSQSVAIDIIPARNEIEMKTMGIRTVAVKDVEEPTWVGRLFEVSWPYEKIKPS